MVTCNIYSKSLMWLHVEQIFHVFLVARNAFFNFEFFKIGSYESFLKNFNLDKMNIPTYPFLWHLFLWPESPFFQNCELWISSDSRANKNTIFICHIINLEATLYKKLYHNWEFIKLVSSGALLKGLSHLIFCFSIEN